MAKMPLYKGFRRKNFHEIKTGIEQSLIASLGSINLMPPSIFASLVAIFAEREALIWQQVEAVYNASYPDTAEGYSLDGVCALTGIIRAVDTYSQGYCQLTALNYTKIPKNSLINVKHSNNSFAVTEDIIVTNEKCCRITIEISDSFKSEYELTINQQSVKYSRLKDDEPAAIAAALATVINDMNNTNDTNNTKNMTIGISAIAVNNSLSLSAINYWDEFSCFVADGLKILDCTNNAPVIATKTGAIIAPTCSLTEIHTPVAGWISVSNASAVKIGNNLESDRDLRARRNASIKLGGSGTFESIRANLLNLDGVTAARITENNSDRVDQHGLPPHSFEVLITGGDDVNIAKLIWQKKPAGIKTHGRLGVVIIDSTGTEQVINFSRPSKVFVHAQITLTTTPHFNQECLPEMTNRLAEQINKLGASNNVILKALFVSIFREHGIAGAVIKLGGTSKESLKPNLSEQDIKIKASEVAFTDASKIEIITKDF
jgi:uncharacterized phage protein gp47/JayE